MINCIFSFLCISSLDLLTLYTIMSIMSREKYTKIYYFFLIFLSK
nr:MAG TPA: hypothetical protein [Caudoviricetes sp.]